MCAVFKIVHYIVKVCQTHIIVIINLNRLSSSLHIMITLSAKNYELEKRYIL